MANNDDQVAITVDRSADLRITKTSAGDAVAGKAYGYIIRVGNDGPSDASDIVFTDTLPVSTTLQTPLPGGCSLSTGGMVCSVNLLPAGDELTYNITIDLDWNVVTGTVLTNSVTVDGAEDDPLLDNNADIDEATAVNQADLSISKTASAATVYAGETVTYTLSVYNNGPSIATGVTVTDTYPDGFNVVAWSESCTDGATISCNLDQLDIGASATITITGTPVVSGTLTNSAVVNGNVIDLAPGNDDVDVDLISLPAADLRIPLPDNVQVPAGTDPTTEPITITIVVSNTGPLVASNSVLTVTLDVLKNQWEFYGSNYGCAPVNEEVVCNLDAIPADSGVSVDISFLFGNQIVSTGSAYYDAIVSTTTHDRIPGNNVNSGVIFFP
jgi:uncharacterized repeat protein (TIGR01451 family)